MLKDRDQSSFLKIFGDHLQLSGNRWESNAKTLNTLSTDIDLFESHGTNKSVIGSKKRVNNIFTHSILVFKLNGGFFLCYESRYKIQNIGGS